jgi:peptide/nickel transport system ATP-binding protein
LLPLLQIKNLSVDFPSDEGTVHALQDFSMDVNRGEIMAVVGESGSGKSVMSLTLMKLLSSAALIKNGSVLLSVNEKTEVELLGLNEKEFQSYRGNRLAMIFQEPMTSLNPVLTCGAQIREALVIHKKLNGSRAKTETLQLLKKVRIDDPALVYDKYPFQLSGGQKQRVMIAMAISCNPSVLICDEPTTALDVIVQKAILDLLKELCRSEQMSIIFITHDLGLVADIADRVLVLLHGRVIESGLVKELFSDPKNPYTRSLLMCRPSLHPKGTRLPVVSDFLAVKNYSSVEKSTILSNKTFQTTNVENSSGMPSEIFLSVKELRVRHSSPGNFMGIKKHWVDAIADVNFEVYRGETIGIVGESGSGKTTLGRALLGLNKPIQGSILYGEKDLLRMNKQQLLSFRKNIQIVFQDPYSSLNPRLMIGPAISEPLKIHESFSAGKRKEHVLELLSKVDLKPEYFNRYPHAFSGGQRQRIVIARALSLNPGFVVFDESVSALDVSVQAQVLNLINDLKQKLGFTAVFISHDLSVIRYLCDRVLVMEKGRIIESGNVEDIYQNPKTNYTRSLIDAIPGKKLGL